jgi:hypothetical protein
MSFTILYERLDGTYFVGSLFHPQMEHASVPDPVTGEIRTFKTVYSYEGIPIKRVEVAPYVQEQVLQQS